MQSKTTRHALPLVSSSFSALLFAMLPKCPACLVLLLAPLGIKIPASRLFLGWAVMMLVSIPLAFFWTPACRTRGIRPLVLALAGLGVMAFGRFSAESTLITTAGAAMMLAAGVWVSRLPKIC